MQINLHFFSLLDFRKHSFALLPLHINGSTLRNIQEPKNRCCVAQRDIYGGQLSHPSRYFNLNTSLQYQGSVYQWVSLFIFILML